MSERVRQSLADRLLCLDSIITKEKEKTMNTVSEEDTHKFVEAMKNCNTQSKTKSDMKKICQWFVGVGEARQPEDIPPKELDLYVARMILSFKKADGEEYEPDTLKCIYGSLCRHLNSKNYPVNITSDLEFKHSRDVLASKRKNLKQKGLGNKKKRADPFTDDEMTILKQKSLLGADNPEALINTIWLNNTLHFGLRGRQEHVDMLWGDFEYGCTASGRNFVMFTERATKTRNGVASDPRKFMPKLFEEPGDPYCPVKMFKVFEEKRPKEMLQPESRFYLGINRNYQKVGNKTEQSWYMAKAMGKNTLGSIAKCMSEKAGFTSRHVNHSGRKTCISKLLDANCPPNEVLQLSGHKNLLSLNSYNTISMEKQINMSNILHGKQWSSVQTPLSHQSNNTINQTEALNIINQADEFQTLDISDQDIITASQEIESTLQRIERYETCGQAIDLPVVQSPGGTLSLKQKFQPHSLFNGCTFNQPVNIVLKQ